MENTELKVDKGIIGIDSKEVKLSQNHILQVQKGYISPKSLFAHIDKGLNIKIKKEE